MPPMTSSERIKRAYSLYAHVTSYGIDGANLHFPSELAARINLHPGTFFKHLYVSRNDDEQYIKGFLESGSMSLWIVGSVGVGKSTVVNKVLREYNSTHKLPHIVIDFKVDELRADGQTSLDTAIHNLISQHVFNYLRTHQLTRQQLARLFCKDRRDRLLSPGPAQSAFQGLVELFVNMTSHQDISDSAFHDWITTNPLNGQEKKRVEDSLSQFAESLSAKDLLFAITNLTSRNEVRRAIILFDNLDSIQDITLREGIKQWLRTSAENYKRSAYFVACVRPENSDQFIAQQTLAENSKKVFAEGATVIMKISLDAGEMSTDDLDEYEKHQGRSFFDPEDDLYVDPPPDTPMGRRRIFDDLIQCKRVDFLQALAQGKQIEGIEKEDIRTIADACREILSNRSVNRDIQMLSNGNRRDMLAGVANFLEYVVRELDLEWDKLGRVETDSGSKRRGRRGSAIKSLYYQWVASCTPGMLNPSVFDVNCFNPVEWVEEAKWLGNELRDNVAACGLSSIIHCLRKYYILAALYNLGGNTVAQRYRESVRVERIISTCASIGIPTAEMVEFLVHLIRAGRVRYHGILETTRFGDIYSGQDTLKPNDLVWITDRGCRVLEQTGVMFNYLAELWARRKQLEGNGYSRRNDAYQTGVIDLDLAKDTVEWICRAVTTELRAIEIFSERIHKTDKLASWSAKYNERFCIKKTHRADGDGASFLCHRIVRSSAAYLEHVAILAKKEDQSEYADLAIKLRKIDSLIKHIARDGRFDLVPRDRPIRAK